MSCSARLTASRLSGRSRGRARRAGGSAHPAPRRDGVVV